MTKEEYIKNALSEMLNSDDFDIPYLICEHGIFSKKDVVEHIENETDLGISIMENIEKLNKDLIKRGKLPLWD